MNFGFDPKTSISIDKHTMSTTTNTAEDDCSGCDALGVFKMMTGGLPNKGQNNSANKGGSDTPKKTNNNENKKTNTSGKPGNCCNI